MTEIDQLIKKVAEDTKMSEKSVEMLVNAQKQQHCGMTDKEAVYRVAKNLGSKAVMKEAGNEGNIRVIHCKKCDGTTFKVVEIILEVNDLYLGRYTETICEECKEVLM